jgi:hypothetical protein
VRHERTAVASNVNHIDVVHCAVADALLGLLVDLLDFCLGSLPFPHSGRVGSNPG